MEHIQSGSSGSCRFIDKMFYDNQRNRKGQIFVISVIIAVTVALTTSYALLHYMFKETNPEQTLSSYQSAIVDALIDGDKILLYVDQASDMAVSKAFDEYAYGNPKSISQGDASDSDIKYCGSYIYRMWNSINRDCYPNYNSQDFEINSLINKNMAEATYLQELQGTDPYFDNLLKQKVLYDYIYYPYSNESNYTTIVGDAETGYTIYALRDDDVRKSDSALNYIDGQISLTGDAGDIAGVPLILSSSDNYRQTNSRQIKYIVIHYTAGYSIKDALQRFQTPGAKASAHYIIGRTNEEFKVVQSVKDKDVAYHAGCDNAVYGCTLDEYRTINTNSVGIEIVNSGFLCDKMSSCYNDKDESLCVNEYIMGGVDKQGTGSRQCWQKYPDQQYQKVVALTAILAKKYNVPIDRQHIIGHVEVVQKNKVDPGPAFDLDRFVQDVQSAVAKDEAVLAGILYSANSEDCMKSSQSKWEISDAKLSGTKFTDDQVLKISMEFENNGEACVNIRPKIYFKRYNDGKVYTGDLEYSPTNGINVYKKSDASPVTTTEIKCSFATDPKFAESERKAGRCVIDVPDDGSEKTYYVGISGLDNNNKLVTYSGKLQFSVAKSTADTQPENIIPTAVVQLSKSEQAKFDSTKQNLENLNILNYIAEQSAKAGVPKEIVLGLITQESGGNMNAGSPVGAYGLMQVMKSTFDGVKFDDKCSWDEYKNDAKCQIRAGIAVLAEKNKAVGDKTIYYKCSLHCPRAGSSPAEYVTCKSSCPTTGCIGPVDSAYTGWEAALRRYNGGGWEDASKTDGAGCGGSPDYEYVERVIKYASAWGYAGGFSNKVKEEMYVGILGTYLLEPVFNVKIDFDMTLFDMLNRFARDTVKECGVTGVDRNKCIKERMDSFNKDLPQVHKDNGVMLNRSCDLGPEAPEVNRFVAELNDCMMSQSNNCRCKFSSSDMTISLDSSEGSTRISYYSSDKRNIQEVKGLYVVNTLYADYSIVKPDNSFWKINDMEIKDIVLLKDGKRAVVGDTTASLSRNFCSTAKNKFEFCLNSGYKYTTYNPDTESKVIDRYYRIPFVITVRDDKAPGPVTGLKSENLLHSKNSVILKWQKGQEEDIVGYNIYLSDSQQNFIGRPSVTFKATTAMKSLGALPEDYIEYRSINLAKPVCRIESGNAGGSQTSTGSTPATPQPTDDTKYCIFEYTAFDKEGKSMNIQLEKERPYYLSDSKEFLYILDGLDIVNVLQSGRDKFITVTAIDVDGNEIDNIKQDELVTLGKNMISTKPEDLLEAGFSEITNMILSADNSVLRLSWEIVQKYIDGTDIAGQTPKYKVYMGSFSCTGADPYLIKSLNALGGGTTYPKNQDVGIPLGSPMPGWYCIGVSALSNNNKEYEQIMVRSLQVPDLTPVQPNGQLPP